MRNSNLQFAKGSIVFADFPSNSDLAYLNQRPLLVVSHPIYIFNQIVICPIGSRMRPGIQCRLWNYKSEKPWGGYEIGTIYPYNLVSIRTEAISRQIGMMDHFIMREVDRAIAFFLGLSEEIPEFMKDREEFYSVEYTHLDQAIDCSQKLNWEYERTFSTMVCPSHESDETQQPAEPKSEESQVETESDSQMEESGSPETQTETEPEKSEEKSDEDMKKEDPIDHDSDPIVKCGRLPAAERNAAIDKYLSTFSEFQKSIAYKIFHNWNALYICAFVEKYCIFIPDEITTSAVILQYYNKIYKIEGWNGVQRNSGFGRSLLFILKSLYSDRVKISNEASPYISQTIIIGLKINIEAIANAIEQFSSQEPTITTDIPADIMKPQNEPMEKKGEIKEKKIEVEPIELPDGVDDEVRNFTNARIILDPKTVLPYNHQAATKYIGLKSMCMILSRRVPLEAVALKYGFTMAQAAELRKAIMDHTFAETENALIQERNPNKFNKYHSLYKIALAIMLEFKLYQPNSGKILVQLNQVTLPVRNEYRIKFTDNSVWADMGGGYVKEPRDKIKKRDDFLSRPSHSPSAFGKARQIAAGQSCAY